MAQGNPKALIPILVFVVLYLGLGITLVALRVYGILKTAWATPMSPAFSPVGRVDPPQGWDGNRVVCLAVRQLPAEVLFQVLRTVKRRPSFVRTAISMT